ncbi:MAG: ABC transporter ATP-binding protein [Planctomyces sp.]|nr:ABC transporter ATP-binding protein [Planctomyces sp.]
MSESSATTVSPVLTLENVRKTYRGREALKGISLELRPGELLGFFGPNGAGKTTMIRCISGLLKPDSGKIIRHPFDDPDDDEPVRLGLVPQNLAIYPDLTVQQNLEIFGRLEGVTGKVLKYRIEEVLEWAALKDRTRSLTKTLSGGMQRRLNIACSVLHDPDILLLDEPTVGVDPQSRERIYEMMKQLTEDGAAVLLTTHQLEEVETRCDRIVVMDHGAIVADGTLSELVSKFIGHPHRVNLKFDHPCSKPLASFIFDEPRTSATCSLASMKELPQVLSVLKQLEQAPSRIDVRSYGLQDVFLELTGRSLRE